MMIIDRFNREIKGEKLLYSQKEKYTEEESKLIVETVAHRINSNLYYGSLICDYMPLLTERILPNVKAEELKLEKEGIAREMQRHAKMLRPYITEEHDFGHQYIRQTAGMSQLDSYFDSVLKYHLDGKEVEEILKDDLRSFISYPDTDFLITANMLFTRYPKFYNDEYVLRLTDMVRYYDVMKIHDPKERENYITAKKSTLQHIKKYTKKRKKEKKEQKKLLKKTQKK